MVIDMWMTEVVEQLLALYNIGLFPKIVLGDPEKEEFLDMIRGVLQYYGEEPQVFVAVDDEVVAIFNSPEQLWRNQQIFGSKIGMILRIPKNVWEKIRPNLNTKVKDLTKKRRRKPKLV